MIEQKFKEVKEPEPTNRNYVASQEMT